MKNTSIVVALIAMVIAIGAGIYAAKSSGNVGASGTRFPNGLSTDTTSPNAGQVRTTTLKAGTSGTNLAGIVTGSCTIWSAATTISATSTSQVECQSATNGSLASGLTGVTADSMCVLTNASSTNTTIGSIGVAGVSASSTAGSIVARILNLTGTTFTWDATASSSAKWSYTCFDPA